MTTRVLSQPDLDLAADSTLRRRVVVRGVVQGVGFRPFLARIASELQLTGHCGNDESSVFIEAEGPLEALDELHRRITSAAPPMSVVTEVSTQALSPQGDRTFRIVPSRPREGGRTLVPPDVGTCLDCVREVSDPDNRRYRHPFATCADCGPRFTIIMDLPYDRPVTTMAGFDMCARCRQEYDDPSDRRYHAQPIACHACGPRMWVEHEQGPQIRGDNAVLAHLQQVLTSGGVVAIKGVGGFHLACDATDAGAVAKLRARKHRPDKPFAVMVADLASIAELAQVAPEEARLLTHPARPVVLLRHAGNGGVADGVAPGLDEIGVILPYTPLHHLLFAPTPGSSTVPPHILVMTSGNLSDEPLCYSNEQARDRLAHVADAFLMHDREIAVPCEDSVVSVHQGAELPVRRSRGFAPLPVKLADRGPVTLAVGAEVKNTLCLTRDNLAFCSGHLGDMGSLESQQVFTEALRQMVALHAVTPELVVADDHPGYATRQWAERYSRESGVPLVTVQHHHAHVASLLAEHGMVGTPVVGVAFDGTGYGCDSSVWGGEVLHVGADITQMRRLGHLEPFLLAGGDRAVRRPFRVAMALLHAAGVPSAEGLDFTTACSIEEQAVVSSQLAGETGCVRTSSMGRLFDGVASLLGVRHEVTYEAQAAIELEALARSADRAVDLPMEIVDGRLRLEAIVRELVAGVRANESPADLALGFHHAVAVATASLVVDLAHDEQVTTVGLTGGVFQNRLLLAELSGLLSSAGLVVLTHRRVPPNDGGLSLGQAVVGRALAGTTTEGDA